MKKWLTVIIILVGFAWAEEIVRPFLPFADKQGKNINDLKEVRKYFQKKAYSHSFKTNEGRSFRGDEFIFNDKININELDNFESLGVNYFFPMETEPDPFILYRSLTSDIGIIGTVISKTYQKLSETEALYGTLYQVRIDSVAWDKGYLSAKPEFVYFGTLSGLAGSLSGEFGFDISDRLFLMGGVFDQYYESGLPNKLDYFFYAKYAFDLTNSNDIKGSADLNEFKEKLEIKTIYDLLERTEKIHKLNDAKNFFNRKYE